MKTYTIDEVLSKFENKNDKAYACKGDVKGTVIFVDTDENNRITTLYHDGTIKDALYINLNENLKKEEARHWVFVREVLENKEEGKEIMEEIEQVFKNAVSRLNVTVSKEEREEAKKILLKQSKISE